MTQIYFPPFYEDLLKILRSITPLSEDALELIRPYVSFRTLHSGEKIQHPNEVCRKVFAVKSGILRNYMSDHSNEITRWFAVEGDVFTSMMSFWDNSPSPACIEAVTKCEIWEIDTDHAREALKTSQEWRDWLLKMIMEGIALQEKRDYRFISTDAYTRFKNMADYRTKEFLNQIPMSIMASYLRCSPRTLSRCRKKYVKEDTNDNQQNNNN